MIFFQITMAGNLTNDERKWVIKQYWKTENAENFRQKWARVSNTPPQNILTVYRLRDKFDHIGSICNVPKSGRTVSVTAHENNKLVSLAFTGSQKKNYKKESFY
jgi:hypothetical protein